MRPLRLDLHGFTVFREPTTVDLTDADYFALVGPTGSGKSTILDAMCFALYGTVPRWGDRRRIENALAPSAAEARVRLVFEAAGVRFVATRVVRRDGKGKISTSHAGLEQLPAGFNLASLDVAPGERTDTELGIVLAGTPSEMEAAVIAAVGLPYEQFIKCVILPQGEFANFLHAKPAERQEILVNLLGLHVYQRIGERAGMVQREAEARAAATRGVLADLTGTDSSDGSLNQSLDRALEQAQAAVDAASTLQAEVDALLPHLAEANTAAISANADLARLELEISLLAGVRMPAAVPTLGEQVGSAVKAAEVAQASVHTAEENEEKARAELAAAGDAATLRRLVDAHTERATLSKRVDELAALVTASTTAQQKATTALAAARAKAEKAAQVVAQVQHAVEAAQTADRAGALRAHLIAGEPCPVCAQQVSVVPSIDAPALAKARTALAAAEKSTAAAQASANEKEKAVREAERAHATAVAQHGAAAQRLAETQTQLAEAPDLATLNSHLAAIAAAEKALSRAVEAVRTARQEARGAATRARAAQEQLTSAWREFDRVRDGVAALVPPPVQRDDVVSSWQTIQNWAGGARADRDRERESVLAVAESALAAITDLVTSLDRLLTDAGVASVGATSDPGAYRQTGALAVERAAAALQRVVERREQADRLGEQVAAYERDAQVAKSLAQHLRANQFERWLLAEALDALVAGASRILRELSAGQYDLSHDKGEFYVIDHADAALPRPVRTLSGGETFQASLALALALSEQLAGLSTASASLESIMLDEGFGTLDSTTLDTVAATLENLAAHGDRMVGVVTHVAALAERIPVRFQLSKDARGCAEIVRVD